MIITSTKTPTTSTPGAVGDIILNPETGDVYRCTAIGKNMSDYGFVDVYSHAVDQYTWEKFGGGVKATTFYLDLVNACYIYHDIELTKKVSKAEYLMASESGPIFIFIADGHEVEDVVGTLIYATVINPEKSDEDYAEIYAYYVDGDYITYATCHTGEYTFAMPV